MTKRYAVRELAWLKGSKTRLVDRCRYFHEACRLAENLSLERRQVAVEQGHVQLGIWLNGQRI
jgi:hypothetical protein